MANLNDPFGYRLVSDECEIKVTEYTKTAGAAIYPGDLVKLIAAGTVSPYVAGDGKALGVAAEFQDSASTTLAVIDDPRARYRVQTDAAAGFAAGDEGINADIGAAPSPDTALNQSGMVLDMATKAITATLPVKVLKLAPQINQADNAAGVNADVIVQLNNTVQGGGDGSSGI